MDEIGRPVVFNICMLGALTGLTQLIKPQSIMKVLERRTPAGILEVNKQALKIGLEMAEHLDLL